MAKTRALVKRRQAVQNIRKITRTMELIATTRFKKAMDRASEAEAYTRKIAELAADLSASAGNLKHPLLEKRETVKNSLLLVLTSNRGLCGGYNASILREAISAFARSSRTTSACTWNCPAGAPSSTSATRAFPPNRTTPSSRTSRASTRWKCWPTATSRSISRARIDRVEVAYMKFFNAARQ